MTARQTFFNPRSLLAADVDDKLRRVALFVLAEKHVGLISSAATKTGNTSGEFESLLRELGSILRDFRTLCPEIPVSWVD